MADAESATRKLPRLVMPTRLDLEAPHVHRLRLRLLASSRAS
jgi:hypothetical protein